MNDRYLCKAKSIDSGKWVQGYYIKRIKKTPACIEKETDDDIEHLIVYNSFSDWDMPRHLISVKVDPATLCRCTGLKDKNSKLIWENDFVQCGGKELVVWDEHFASWCLIKEGWAYKHFFGEAQMPEDCEVVGNKFDNPELLEECDTD